MPYSKRTSFRSSTSSFSSASPASTPGTSFSSSGAAPSPIAVAAAALACPDIAECDEDTDPRPPSIVIGDLQFDDAPFDPSLSDEMHCARHRAAAAAAARAQAQQDALGASPTSSLHDRLARFVSRSARHRGGSPPPASTPPLSASPPEHRRSRFRLRRGSSAEKPGASPVRDAGVQSADPPRATLVSSTIPARLSLVPLDVAQARESIVRHPEGFELKEAARRAHPRM